MPNKWYFSLSFFLLFLFLPLFLHLLHLIRGHTFLFSCPVFSDSCCCLWYSLHWEHPTSISACLIAYNPLWWLPQILSTAKDGHSTPILGMPCPLQRLVWETLYGLILASGMHRKSTGKVFIFPMKVPLTFLWKWPYLDAILKLLLPNQR